MKKRAVISVSDKTGVVEFARGLEKSGYEIVSTGGTARELEKAGVRVINISDVTGFPECLDGRVKTLHPMIHAGILAMRDNPAHMEQVRKLNVALIDVVAINLYPFKQTILKENVTFEEAIENIDIGGPTMIRAAAKNWQDVTVIVDPMDYDRVLGEIENGGQALKPKALAYKVFEHTAAYDALISRYLRKQNGLGFPDKYTPIFEKVQDLIRRKPAPERGVLPEIVSPGGTSRTQQLHGKELSYNNINDANGAIELLKNSINPARSRSSTRTLRRRCRGFDLRGLRQRDDADPVSIYGGLSR